MVLYWYLNILYQLIINEVMKILIKIYYFSIKKCEGY